MAKKPARAADYTGYEPYQEPTPGSNVDPRDRPSVAWSLSGGEQKSSYAGSNPAGATPEPWVSGYAREVTPYNVANPAAMRAYTRNAPYMESLISDPKAMMDEMQYLIVSLKQNPNDPVSEYRFRILRQALGDVYGVQPKEFMGGPDLSYPVRALYPTTGQR